MSANSVPMDQYDDGIAAELYDAYVGCRPDAYNQWICKNLKEHNCETVLDAACGTGIDSVMLINQGFQVTSTDYSDQMLKYAFKRRWTNRKDERFENWVIEQANWLTLADDLENAGVAAVRTGFDAVICLGNSFAHLPDTDGDQRSHKRAMANLASMVKPGGILLIDHRNYDGILKTGVAPQGRTPHINSQFVRDIKCFNLFVDGKPASVTLEYVFDMEKLLKARNGFSKSDLKKCNPKFRLTYYPHERETFTAMLEEAFGPDCKYEVFADFSKLGELESPAYYHYLIQKPALNQ
ncbi:glycine N-methyltransferase-like [Tubulanus polymorphus]|uniref:glycine N-methyltransferase-like n=1 Tax=Tubulanus polymorphus TaxID=672921 RepID=UPI003DA4F356